jgi:hypothetical protein
MNGRTTRLVSRQQLGTIAAEDGVDYMFHSRSLIDATFSNLRVGAKVTFSPMGSSVRRGENARLVAK